MFFYAHTVLSDATDSNGVKIAVITAISVVLAAAVTAIAQVLQQRRNAANAPVNPVPALMDDLLRRAEESELSEQTLQARIDYLETLCWRNGIDPDTGRKVLGGH